MSNDVLRVLKSIKKYLLNRHYGVQNKMQTHNECL